ncbi:MAG: hypothetical protein PHG23_03075 [Candidatus Pacebacteria bacterium]|nr:hypothetical protein [Candidatus Paceibacterota bacterium]
MENSEKNFNPEIIPIPETKNELPLPEKEIPEKRESGAMEAPVSPVAVNREMPEKEGEAKPELNLKNSDKLQYLLNLARESGEESALKEAQEMANQSGDFGLLDRFHDELIKQKNN